MLKILYVQRSSIYIYIKALIDRSDPFSFPIILKLYYKDVVFCRNESTTIFFYHISSRTWDSNPKDAQQIQWEIEYKHIYIANIDLFPFNNDWLNYGHSINVYILMLINVKIKYCSKFDNIGKYMAIIKRQPLTLRKIGYKP